MKNLSSERAQTTIEFGFVLALVLVAAVVALGLAGQAVLQLWNGFVTAWPA